MALVVPKAGACSAGGCPEAALAFKWGPLSGSPETDATDSLSAGSFSEDEGGMPFMLRGRALSTASSSSSCCSGSDSGSPRRLAREGSEGSCGSPPKHSRSSSGSVGAGGNNTTPVRRTAHDIREHYAHKLGIRDARKDLVGLQISASRRMTCLPENCRVVMEQLKGRPESYGGFLRLMRKPPILPTPPPTAPTPAAPPSSEKLEGPCAEAAGACSALSPCAAKAGTGGASRRAGGLKRGPVKAGPRRRIAFSENVEVLTIPRHSDYSRRVRDQYWASPEEIYEMACRNLIEFEAEGGDYLSAVEEDRMYYDEMTGELVHPAHLQFEPTAGEGVR